jgi:hypothetical protein
LKMKKNIFILTICLAALPLVVGCAGTQWIAEKDLGAVKAYQFGRTGVFGTDHSGTVLVENQQPQLPILRLQYGSTTVNKTTTTFSRCKERKEGRLIQAYFVGEEEKTASQSGFQDAANPQRPPWTEKVGGTNPSTGNVLLPAAAMGAGIATSGFGFPGTDINVGGGNASAGGGAGGIGQGGAGGAGGAGGSAASSSAAASSAAAAAAAD